MDESQSADRASAFAAEVAAQMIDMDTADAWEGVSSFVERRPSSLKGR